MNIIFADKEIEEMRKRYLLLELDTFKFPTGQTIPAYVVVENLPVEKISSVATFVNEHQALLDHYKNRNWTECKNSLAKLMGAFGADVDTYYQTMHNRINGFMEEEPHGDWSYIIEKK